MSDETPESDRVPGAPHPRHATAVIGHDAAAEDFLAEAGVETIWRGGVEYSRVTALKNRPDLDADGHLLEAEVRVNWRERLIPRSVELVTYFAVDTGLDELR